MTIKDRLIDFFADLIPYLNTSPSCLFATALGIAFFSYDGESRVTAAPSGLSISPTDGHF